MSDDEPTTQELKERVKKRAEQDPNRAEKAEYLKEKLEERERSEREAGIDSGDDRSD
jgi:phage regulator Rha-like protein